LWFYQFTHLKVAISIVSQLFHDWHLALSFALLAASTTDLAAELHASTLINRNNIDPVLGVTFKRKPLNRLLTDKVQWQICNYNPGLTRAPFNPVELEPLYREAAEANVRKVGFDRPGGVSPSGIGYRCFQVRCGSELEGPAGVPVWFARCAASRTAGV